MSLDLSQDFNVIDDLQPITLYSKTGEGAYNQPQTVIATYWEELSQEDYQLSPSYLEETARWCHMWALNLSGTVPKLGDKIQDKNGLFWVVKRVMYLDLDGGGFQRFRCLSTASTGVR